MKKIQMKEDVYYSIFNRLEGVNADGDPSEEGPLAELLKNLPERPMTDKDKTLSRLYSGTLVDYGLTEEDFGRLEELMEIAPEQTVLYVMFVSAQNYKDDHEFLNEDALSAGEIRKRCGKFIEKYVVMT